MTTQSALKSPLPKQWKVAWMLILVAFGAALFTTTEVLAANSDGVIQGVVVSQSEEVLADATITVLNEENGYTRSVVADANGRFRIARLPIGTYSVSTRKGGFQSLTIGEVILSIGDTIDLELELLEYSAGVLEEVIVTSAAYSGLYTSATESALNISAAELNNLPVGRSLEAVALLAPGVVPGNRFGGVSFGGASVGENAVFINGLNISDVETGVGASNVPFEMYKEFQVKTGGYSVEFGRTTGGVLNAVLKSGSNNFSAGADVFYTPDALRGSGKDFFNSVNDRTIFRSEDESDGFRANIWASGPIIKDKLLYYVLYQPRNDDTTFFSSTGSSRSDSKDDSAFWGGKVDWFITDNHSLEAFVFSDETDRITDRFQDDEYSETATYETGGTNWGVTYTGQFTDRFTVKALYGKNERSVNDFTNVSTECNRVYDNRDIVDDHISCTTQRRNDHRVNSRDALRFDMEYALDTHLIRGGFDYEERTTLMERASVGPALANFQIYDTVPGASVNDTTVPDGVYAYVRERREIRGGTFDAETSAAYLEDVWSVSDDVTATIGLRWDEFDSKDAAGNSFLKVSNMFSPRLGVTWDVGGDGRTRLYANAGRYYFPIANGLAAREGGGTIDTRTFYALAGLDYNETSSGLTNVTPIFGEQIGDVLEFGSSEGRTDKDFVVDHDLDASFQDEFIFGFERDINIDWSIGARVIYRKFQDAIEDMKIDVDVPGCGNITKWVFGNVGRPLTINHDCDMGGVQTVTIDLGQAQSFGYDLDGDGNPDPIGSDRPVRKYSALELVIERHWDDRWMARFSYTLSKSEGNYEGGVNSDTGNDIPGWTESGDDVMFINSNYGLMANDHRNLFKAFGSYAITDKLAASANLNIVEGSPINARGHGNPFNSQTRKEMNYVCVDNCLDTGGDWTSQDRVFDYVKRGQFGRTPWLVRLDLGLHYSTEMKGHEFYAGIDVFNILNTQVETRLNEFIQDGSFEPDEDFLSARNANSPRSVRLNAGMRW